MYIIKTDDNRYYSDHICGCDVYKNHITRAALFTWLEEAEEVLSYLDEICDIVIYEEEL